MPSSPSRFDPSIVPYELPKVEISITEERQSPSALPAQDTHVTKAQSEEKVPSPSLPPITQPGHLSARVGAFSTENRTGYFILILNDGNQPHDLLVQMNPVNQPLAALASFYAAMIMHLLRLNPAARLSLPEIPRPAAIEKDKTESTVPELLLILQQLTTWLGELQAIDFMARTA